MEKYPEILSAMLVKHEKNIFSSYENIFYLTSTMGFMIFEKFEHFIALTFNPGFLFNITLSFLSKRIFK